MKTLICLFICLPWLLYAQPSAPDINFAGNVKTNVLAPFSLAYEGAVTGKQSLLLELRYSPTADLFARGYRMVAAAEMRFYLDKFRSGLQGFYVGPYVKYRHMTVDKQEDVLATLLTLGLLGTFEKELKLHTFGLGGHAGYQWILRRGFTLNAFGGVGYNPIVSKRGNMIFEKKYSADVRLGFSLGIAIPPAR